MPTIVLGWLVRPIGLRGELKLQESTDFWEAALGSTHLRLRDADGEHAVRVASHRPYRPGSRALHLQAVTHREAAEACVGGELVLQAEALDVDGPEDLRPFQVIGLPVRTDAGMELGVVEDLWMLPGQTLFVIRDGDRQHLVPNVPEFVPAFDVSAGVLEVHPIPGLLEL